jgi:formylmethanofuran dehydrogenase subunit E
MLNKIRNYFQYFLRKDGNFKCNDCGFEILPLMAYYQNDNTGEVLCRDCFDKKVLNGEILLTKV